MRGWDVLIRAGALSDDCFSICISFDFNLRELTALQALHLAVSASWVLTRATALKKAGLSPE